MSVNCYCTLIGLFPLAFILITLIYSLFHYSRGLSLCAHICAWKNLYAQIHLLMKDGTTPKYFQKSFLEYFKLLFILFVF